MEGDRLIKRVEAAALLGISVWTIRRWEAQGRLHPVKFNCSNVRLRQSEVMQLMNGSAGDAK